MGGKKIDIIFGEQGDKNLDIKMEKIKEECTEGKNIIIGGDFRR